MAERDTIDAKWPGTKATFQDFMNHLNHALKVAGRRITWASASTSTAAAASGLNDASDYWKISQALLDEGYTQADLEKIERQRPAPSCAPSEGGEGSRRGVRRAVGEDLSVLAPNGGGEENPSLRQARDEDFY